MNRGDRKERERDRDRSSYSSEMLMFICSLSAMAVPARWSLVMISMRWSLLNRKSPLAAEAEPYGDAITTVNMVA